MISLFKERFFAPLIHLIYPHLCAGCDSDLLKEGEYLCYNCFRNLPLTHFSEQTNNPVEKRFWGRIQVQQAMAACYLVKDSIVQHMVYELKYKGYKKLGIYLGELMGKILLQGNRFKEVDLIVPIPLHKSKEKSRGFNQSALLARGINNILHTKISEHNIIRIKNTESQTRKDRLQRWSNVEDKFEIKNIDELKGKHLLIVDDVLTTGATIDACVSQILSCVDVKISIAVFALATE